MPDENPVVYAVRVQERAIRDITAETVRLAETTSDAIGLSWREGVKQAIAGLALNPRRYPVAPETFRVEVRQVLYRRPGSSVAHRVLFLISGEAADAPDGPTVMVLHVRHAQARPVTRQEARGIEAELPPA